MKHNRYLGLIIARGGSKGLPDKNILECASKPLIQWTIEAANSSNLLDKVILSTDDSRIIEVAKKCDCEVPFVRPKELAEDNSPVSEVIKHALDSLAEPYSHIVLLQATSPCRTTTHIAEAIQKFESSNYDTLVSVYKAPQKAGWTLRENSDSTINFILDDDIQQRQKLPNLYYPNGAIYIANVESFSNSFYGENTGFYLMDQEDSIDIDTIEEFHQAQSILEKR